MGIERDRGKAHEEHYGIFSGEEDIPNNIPIHFFDERSKREDSGRNWIPLSHLFRNHIYSDQYTVEGENDPRIFTNITRENLRRMTDKLYSERKKVLRFNIFDKGVKK